MLQKKDKHKIIFFRESVFRVAEAIFNFPNKTFHIRMLEKETEFSTTAIIDAVNELKSFGIIEVFETPITKNIKAKLDSEAYGFYKIIFNLYRLKRYGFVDNLLEIFNNPEAIVLYGSFAKGEDIEESDVDFLVISSNASADLSTFKNTFEKEMHRKIDITVLPSLDKSSAEFKNAVANGIVLHGYLKVL